MARAPREPEPDNVWGIAPELCEATHDPDISEHAAGRFFLSWNGGLVRNRLVTPAGRGDDDR